VGPSLLSSLALFAQDAPPAPPAGGGEAQWVSMLLPIVAIGFLFYFLLIRPQRSEERKRQDMLGTLKKNDRVLTLGGIFGVVTNVHREANEVTIKVDESTNTKLRVQLSAITRVVGSDAADDSSSK
jgi:preprotein translocase subunit YajC